MPEASQYKQKPDVLTATIAISTDTSDAVPCHGCTFCVMETPAVLTGTSFTFQGSINGSGGTFTEIRNSAGIAITYTVSASGSYILDPADFVGYDAIKIVSGSTELAAREIKLKAIAI